MKIIMTWFVASLLAVEMASAESVTATDGGTAAYGACNGFAIDFDATAAPSAVWTPALVNGQSYTLNSVDIKNSTGNSGTYYLGVYTGFSSGSGTLSGFLGVSDTANDFSTSQNNWLTFTFNNINYNLTVDSTVGSGSGMLYFVYQSGTSAVTTPGVTLATDKFGTDTYMTNSLAGIIAYNALQANRSPQYQATITPVSLTAPPATPTGLSATGSNAAVILKWTASFAADSYNVKRSLASGSELTVTNVTGTSMIDTGLINGTPYYYVVSATNSYGESTNSVEVSATPMPPPAAPTDVTAIASNTTVALTWTASVGATGYNVKRSLKSGSGYVTVASVTGTNVMDTGLNYSTTYYYVVSAISTSGEGTNSTETSVTTEELPGSITVTNLSGASVVVGSNGVYLVNFTAPAWTFSGNLNQTLTGLTSNTGTDNIGDYSEITFNYTSAVPHLAGIRLYTNSPVVIFSDTTLAAGANDLAFPHLINYPKNLNYITFIDTFTVYSFTKLYEPWAPCDNLFLYFNTNHDAFILSAATNYTISTMLTNGDTSISCGINSGISQLPSGFTHRFILTAQNGINKSYSTWGNALLALADKTPPANDAVVELNKLGYWTDNGAAYYPYYNGTAPGIANTLLSIKDEFASNGVPISYMQLDSWWYEKGSNAVWNDPNDGFYLYEPDPYLFTNGLAAFQQQLGLPLITHNRWVYSGSPYITDSNYTASGLSGGGVIIDPRFWTNIMTYLKSSGVMTYEQDWLNYRGIPDMNLTDPPAYLNNMAWAAAANDINLQYCMVQGRDYLQSTLFTNLMTIRTSEDRFDTNRWPEHLYGSRFAEAMGIWPWTDVCMSTETRNILLETLSAGPVGPGDALGTLDATNLLKAVRPDGVIVKPDVPLVPVDDAYVNDALGQGRPLVATTYTDDTNSRALYVFAYAEDANKPTSSFRPADFGITNDAYVYDYFAATGMVVNAGDTFNFTTTVSNAFTGGSYFITVPIGPSGIAFLGDTNKFVTRGKKRISSFSDTGLLRATVAFAAGETNVTLCGYAPSNPYVLALSGSTNNSTYDSATHFFTLNVSPDNSETATVTLSLAPLPSLNVVPNFVAGQFQISWPTNAVGYVLEETTNLTPPVIWSQAPETINTVNGQNLVIVTNTAPAVFYRLRQ